MDIDEIEAKVAQFRAKYEDVTDEEERVYRDHLKNGGTFVFRCRVTPLSNFPLINPVVFVSCTFPG